MLTSFLHRTCIVIGLLCANAALAIELQVKINGVNSALTKSIKNDLNLQQATTESKLTKDRIRNLYQLAQDQIIATLQAKGYYDSRVDQRLEQINGATPDQDKWIATFNITLGQPTKIQSVSIDVVGLNKDVPRFTKLYRTPKLIPGQILTHEDYEDTKDLLLANFHSIGYLQSEFEQSVIEVNRQEHTADIKFTIKPGPQYVFGKINFIDADYPDDFLLRFAPFKPGDPYELQKLIDFQNNLESADLFSKVRFDPLTDLNNPSNVTVPINVRLTMKPMNRYTGSVGYGTDTGARGSLSWLHRRRSTAGHKIFTSINASQKISTAKANYIIPGEHPATDKYVIGGLGQIEKIEELFSRKAEIYGSKMIKRGRLETMYGLWYFTETFRIVYAEPTLNRKFLLPTVKWIWINSKETDDFEFGTRFDFKVRAGAQALLSDSSVAQMEFNGKQIFPITQRMRLLLRGTAGAVASKDFYTLPPTLRFFAGGEDSVRGYAYNSLGPLLVPFDPDSNIGGRYLLIMSGELEHKIYHDLAGVVFFDSGNAALTTKIPLAFGTGVGIRYKTPVGNFRFDVAKPLNIIENKHWRIHMNFGTDL
jgi:translocation and assembly module TamA